MRSATGRHVIAFNGEIYNHLELRAELAPVSAAGWQGGSDTETLLAAIEAWGLEAALRRCQGMFAFALWDRAASALFLARDRMGEKPLYFGHAGRALAFASETKALLQAEGFRREADPAAVAAFLRHGCVPEGQSIWKGVRKVPPGAVIRFHSPEDEGEVRPFWSLADLAREEKGARAARSPDLDRAAADTEAVLADVVASQMISDVPLGAFLSGGVDSTLVTALMQQAASRPVRTFSIGFAESRFDESAHAAAVARHLGTEHTEFTVTEADALALIPELPRIYDEPFADSSQIPTTLLCRLARQDVTVALTGDGGDEMFGGYNRHVFGPRLWEKLRRIPGPLRRRPRSAARLLHRLGGAEGSVLRRLANRAGLPVTAVDKLTMYGGVLGRAESLADLYDGLASPFPDPEAYVAAALQEDRPVREADESLDGLAPAEWMMLQDALGYLPGDILVKVDRAAMSASLETRAPFLDPRSVAAAWKLPLETKIEGRTGKRVLRRILERHVPSELLDRPKQGFAIPLDRWLRGALRDWAESLLTRERIETAGLVRPEPVRRLWQAHQTGRENNGQRLWAVLMLQMWAEEHLAPRPAAAAA